MIYQKCLEIFKDDMDSLSRIRNLLRPHTNIEELTDDFRNIVDEIYNLKSLPDHNKSNLLKSAYDVFFHATKLLTMGCDTDCGVMGFLGASINNVHFQYRKLKDLLDSVKNLQEGVNYERN